MLPALTLEYSCQWSTVCDTASTTKSGQLYERATGWDERAIVFGFPGSTFHCLGKLGV